MDFDNEWIQLWINEDHGIALKWTSFLQQNYVLMFCFFFINKQIEVLTSSGHFRIERFLLQKNHLKLRNK